MDTGRVAQHPDAGIFVNADHQTVVNGPVVLTLAYGFADMDNAVLVDRHRHQHVVLQIVVNAVDFLEIVSTSRDVAELDLTLRVRGQRYVDIIIVMRRAPEAEHDTRDRNELAGGLIDLCVDLQDLDIRLLTEADLSVILMVAGEVRKLRIFTELHRVQQVDVVVRDRIRRLAGDGVGRLHEHGHVDRLVRFENVIIPVCILAQVDRECGGICQSRIVRICRRGPDIGVLRKVVVLGDIEGFDEIVSERRGIVKFPGNTASGKNAHVEALQDTVPVGRLVIDRNEVLERVDQYHILRPGRRIGGEMNLVAVVAAADRGSLVGIPRIARSRYLLVQTQITGGQYVERAFGLGVDELLVIGIRIEVDQILSVRVRGTGGAAVVGISVADINVSGLVHDAVQHVVAEFGDAVPGMVGSI